MGQFNAAVTTTMCALYDTACGYGSGTYDPQLPNSTMCTALWNLAMLDTTLSECLFYSTIRANGPSGAPTYCPLAAGGDECGSGELPDSATVRATVFCTYYNSDPGPNCPYGGDNWDDSSTCTSEYQGFNANARECFWYSAVQSVIAGGNDNTQCANAGGSTIGDCEPLTASPTTTAPTQSPTNMPSPSPTLNPLVAGFDATIVNIMCNVYNMGCGYGSDYSHAFGNYTHCSNYWYNLYDDENWDEMDCLFYNSYYTLSGRTDATDVCPYAAGGGDCKTGSVDYNEVTARLTYCYGYNDTCGGFDTYSSFDDLTDCTSEYSDYSVSTRNCLWYSVTRARAAGGSENAYELYCKDAGASKGGLSTCVTPSPSKDKDSDDASIISCLIGFAITFFNLIRQ
jgi:hypothetical protein